MSAGGRHGEGPGPESRFPTATGYRLVTHTSDFCISDRGRRLEDYLTLLPVEPLTRYFFRDGTVLDASRDLARMAEQIERIEPDHRPGAFMAVLVPQ